MASTIDYINNMQNKINTLQETILMKAFKKDENDELYEWLKSEYQNICFEGSSCIISMIEKYTLFEQEEATEDELKFIDHLYTSYIEFLKIKNNR